MADQTESSPAAEVVVVVAPSIGDASAACEALRAEGITAESHAGGPKLGPRIQVGVAVLLIAQEALSLETLEALARALHSQPAWSDLPVIVMTVAGMRDSPTATAVRDLLPHGNITLLERPFREVTLLSDVRAALRSRARQHAFRVLFDRKRTIMDTVAEGLYTVDIRGTATYVNPRAAALFGWPAAELVGSNMHQKVHYKRPNGAPYPAEECTGLRVLQTGEAIHDFEDVFIRRDGSFFPVVYSAAPLMENGVRVGVVVSFRDDTERRESAAEREQLLDSERFARAGAERANRLKDEFLATLSHELRTPLDAILGWAHLLKRGPSDAEDLARGIEVIERNARMQSQLIADLLDMSRIISGQMRLDIQPVDLPTVIRAALDSIRPAADARAITLAFSCDPETRPINGDPARLQQIVWNLLSNAVKFTPNGGAVRVELGASSSMLELRVSDNGRGIRPEFLSSIFDRFMQADASNSRQFGGLGLGLAIVKQLVELHGGTVRAESAGEGGGATFTVQFPVTAGLPSGHGSPRFFSSPAPAPSEFTCDLRGVTVLVVDDDADAREAVRRILEASNARVLAVGSPDEALPLIPAHNPDVLLSDIAMPGEDGYRFIRRVRAAGYRVPAAALTALARTEDSVRALRAGYQSHVSKPVEPSDLMRTVAALARLPGTATLAPSS